MRVARLMSFALLFSLFIFLTCPVAVAQTAAPEPVKPVPGYQQFLSPASPLELVAAKKVDRLAWVAFEEGKRNAYTAAAPGFRARPPDELHEGRRHRHVGHPDLRRRLDGGVRARHGAEPRRAGWPTRSADPDGPERAIWAARTAGGPAWRVAELPSGGEPGAGRQFGALREGRPDLSREGHAGAAGRAKWTAARSRSSRSGASQSAPPWSPDGKKIAFVTHAHRPQLHRRLRHGDADREVHVAERRLRLEPDVDRRQQEHRLRAPSGLFLRPAGAAGSASIGLPSGPAASRRPAAGAAAAGRARRGGSGRRRSPHAAAQKIPGLTRATFKGGYTYSFWKADVATRRGAGGLAQPAGRSDVHDRREPAPGGRLRRVPLQRRRRRRRRAAGERAPKPPGRRRGRMGSLSTR